VGQERNSHRVNFPVAIFTLRDNLSPVDTGNDPLNQANAAKEADM
jgi:hypothetical protein